MFCWEINNLCHRHLTPALHPFSPDENTSKNVGLVTWGFGGDVMFERRVCGFIPASLFLCLFWNIATHTAWSSNDKGGKEAYAQRRRHRHICQIRSDLVNVGLEGCWLSFPTSVIDFSALSCFPSYLIVLFPHLSHSLHCLHPYFSKLKQHSVSASNT